MQTAAKVICFTAMLLTSNVVLAADNDGDLVNAVREYCRLTDQGHNCIDKQLLAAREQRKAFMDAFNSRNSEGLAQIAIIARCTKQHKSNAGIDYVGIRECMDSAEKRMANPRT